MTDALDEQFMLRTHPRREWLITQIMLLADAYAATQVALAVTPPAEEASRA